MIYQKKTNHSFKGGVRLKRDMDLCRKILFIIEDQDTDTKLLNLAVENYSNSHVAYHCKILNEAGLVEYYDAKYADDNLLFFSVGPLTWKGHDFIDKVREDTTWNNIKKIISKKGLPFTLSVVLNIAAQLGATSLQK